MSEPMVYVWPVRSVPGCVGFDEAGMPLDPKGQVCEVWPAKTLSAALAASYKTDAHFVPYSLVNSEGESVGAPRVNIAAWEQFHELGYWLRFQCIPLDFDDPAAHASGEPASDEWRAEWWATTLPTIERIVACGVLAYETKGGARAVVLLPEAIEGGPYLDIMAGIVAEAEDRGVVIDKLKELQRCYRLPFVTRDGKKEKRRARLDDAGVMDYDAMGRLAMVGQARPMGGKDAATLPERREMPARPPGANERPGEVFERVRAWSDVLSPHGWKFGGMNGSQESWYRPGKKPEGPPSALTNYMGRGKLWVFTTGDGALEAGRSYDKIGAYARLSGLDFSAASRQARDELVSEGHMRGWEERPARAARPVRQDEPPVWASEVILEGGMVAGPARVERRDVAMRQGRVDIECVAGELHTQVEASIGALANEPDLYTRVGMMVLAERSPKGRHLVRVTKAMARVMLERRARFLRSRKTRKGEELEQVAVDDRITEAVIDSSGLWTGVLREVRAVHAVPVLRPNGDVVGEGYDPVTQLLVDFNGQAFLEVGSTRQDAEDALSRLEDLLVDFPFEEPEVLNRTVIVSMMLAAIVRRTLRVSPAYLVDSPSSSVGKNLLVDIASLLMVGRRATITSDPKDEDEAQKKIFSALLAGRAHLAFDNISKPFGGEAFDSIMTGDTYDGRRLGASEMIEVPANALVTITGRNVKFRGDGIYRTLRARMVTTLERPDKGRDFKHKELANYILEHRGQFVRDALTVMRAYLLAGRPNRTPPIKEYSEWTVMAREPLIWLGRPDPAESIEIQRLETDEEMSKAAQVLAPWWDVYRDKPVSIASVVDELSRVEYSENMNPSKVPMWELRIAIEDMMGDKISGARVSHGFSKRMGANAGRPIGGYVFKRATKGKLGVRWQVVKLGAVSDTSAGPARLASDEERGLWGAEG